MENGTRVRRRTAAGQPVNRPFLPFSTVFALGICLSRWGLWESRPFLAPLWVIAALTPFVRNRKLFVGFLLAGFFLLGALSETETRVFPAHSIRQVKVSNPVSLRGRVVSLPEIIRKGKRETVSWIFSTSSLQSEKGVEAVQGNVQVFIINSGARPAYGEEWQLYGFLEPPENAPYPGQFDYRRYLAERKIHFIFKGYGRRSAYCLRKGKRSFLSLILGMREGIKKKMDRYFPFPEREIMSALLIGFQKRIPESIRNDFARTGTAHLLAVSGLNVSIVGGLLYFFLRFFLPRKWNALLSLLLICFYAAISGSGAPVLRAAMMGGLLFAGLVIDKDAELLNSLAVAFFLLLVSDPGNLFSAGFQLSFLSVLGIFMVMPWVRTKRENAGGRRRQGRVTLVIRKTAGFFTGILTATFAATLATLPLVLYYFRIAAPISFLANLVLVPLMNLATFLGFMILPLFFLAPSWAVLAGNLPLLAVKIGLKINALLSQFPFASFYVPSPPLWIIWLYYGVILVFILLPPDSKKGIKSVWFLPGLAVSVGVLAVYFNLLFCEPVFKIHALHLKQGSVAFLEYPGGKRNLLINTGKSQPGREWDRIVKPFLISRGVQTVDAVFLGSCLTRESGGLEGLITDFKCRKIYLPVAVASNPLPRKRVLAVLRRKNLWPRFLGKDEILAKDNGVMIRWKGTPGGGFLEISYRGRQGFVLMDAMPSSLARRDFELAPVAPVLITATKEGACDFVIRLTGLKGSKTPVESFNIR